jgi:hypothetical protein
MCGVPALSTQGQGFPTSNIQKQIADLLLRVARCPLPAVPRCRTKGIDIITNACTRRTGKILNFEVIVPKPCRAC